MPFRMANGVLIRKQNMSYLVTCTVSCRKPLLSSLFCSLKPTICVSPNTGSKQMLKEDFNVTSFAIFLEKRKPGQSL